MTRDRSATTLPFAAVVGAEGPKLALLLAAADPLIGGVLLRGDKGSAKSTLARGLATLLPGDAPFVELPLGATEERLVGSLDLGAALTGGEVRFQPGLLAAAHGGVLYVDEVNLLADHLVDALLDAAASGVNRVERDGVSHEHPARFLLVGSMNPEEGDLRPQLLDRFGLAVDVRNPVDPVVRAEVVRRRQAFDAAPAKVAEEWAEETNALIERLAGFVPAGIDDEVLELACTVCIEAGAESLRADLVLARAAAAHAGWRGAAMTEASDLRAVAPLVLAHRQRRDPLDHGSSQAVEDALDTVLPADDGDEDAAGGGDADPRTDDADSPGTVVPLVAPRRDGPGAGGRRSPVQADRGRVIGSREPSGPVGSVAPIPTLQAAARRRAGNPEAQERIVEADLREPVRQARTGNLLVLAVDASGSMGGPRMSAVKGALLGLLVDAYQRRDRVALVTFGGDGARLALAPTGSIEVARVQLEELPTGGETPLAAGIDAALDVAHLHGSEVLHPLVVLVTDGRATAGADPWGQALSAAAHVARRAVPAVVVDVEDGTGPRLGLAAELAIAMGARHLPLPQLSAGRLESALRSL
jgi:magnesium chelatase subunit D